MRRLALVQPRALAVAADGDSRSTVGVLPPVSWLVVSALAGVSLALVVRRRTLTLFVLPALAVLPWLGFARPILLMWSGPLMALIWIAFGVGIAHDALAPRAIPSMVRRVDRAAVVFLLSVAVLRCYRMDADAVER